MTLAGPWRLHPRVALRPEPFGALAYHYDNRRLNFLRAPELVSVVKDLENHNSIDAALIANAIPHDSMPAFRRALEALARSDFLQPHDFQAPDPQCLDRIEPVE